MSMREGVHGDAGAGLCSMLAGRVGCGDQEHEEGGAEGVGHGGLEHGLQGV